MSWVRAWRLRRREGAFLLAALLAERDELAVRTTAMAAQDTTTAELRSQIRGLERAVVRRDTRLRALLVEPPGEVCRKVPWHTEGEADVFAQWLRAGTNCGELEPYWCSICPRQRITNDHVWHVRHVERSQRGHGDDWLQRRIDPETRRRLVAQFMQEAQECSAHTARRRGRS